MPKNPKPARKQASTLRVAATPEIGSMIADRTGSLQVVQGAEVDLGKLMLVELPVTIGRDENVELSLSDGSISRLHCRVERHDDGYYFVQDLASTNGTNVNGKTIEGHYRLQSDDKIFLGSSVVRFGYVDPLDIEYQSRVYTLVSTDGLTGLSTRRTYDAIFESIAERAVAEQRSLSVLVMDIDGLKQINDTLGHETGSFAIAETAKVVRELLEDRGPMCRYGGDEFTCCMSGVGLGEARDLAEELRVKIEQHHFEHEGVTIHPTLSIGVATFPIHCQEPDTLFSAADRAMYKAKAAGKNCVMIAT
jgi:diguanylate cyclase (GGDEF)-like protein